MSQAAVALTSQPLLADAHPFQAAFPDRRWAIRLPALMLAVLMATVAMVVGSVLVAARRRQSDGRKRS